jgi:hypothetical protein
MIHSDLALVLAALGDSPDKVAASLKAQRIQGVRNTTRFLNPICRYIESVLSLDLLTVDIVEHGSLRISCPDGTTLTTQLSQPIKEFLEAFDRGAYPDLERPLS